PSVSDRRLWIVGGLLLAAVVLIALAILPALRSYKFRVPGDIQPQREPGAAVFKTRAAPVKTSGFQGNGFSAGPRQVSLQLKPWKRAVRKSTPSSPKAGGAFDRLKSLNPKPSQPPAYPEPQRDQPAPVAEPFFEAVGPVVEQRPVVPAGVSHEA